MKTAILEPVGGHGGMDYYDYGLAQGLGWNDVEVFLFTSEETKKREYKLVNSHLGFKKVWGTKNKFLRLFYFLKGYYLSFKEAKRKGVETIHFQFFGLGTLNFLVVLLASCFSFRKVLTLHDISSFKSSHNGVFDKMILNSFDKIIVHNDFSYEELINKIKNPKKTHIVPHGNYLPFVKELDYVPKEEEPLRLLFFGQIKEVKGVEILLEALQLALKENKNIHLTIAGKPWHDDVGKYKDLIASLGLENHVTTVFEYIDDSDVPSYFKESDLVVLPYKKIYQSGVLLLSMSYGRAVLTSDLPAFREIVEHQKTGLLFESENPVDLTNKILMAAENKYFLHRIQKNALKVLKTKFDWKEIGRKTKEVYECA